MENIASLIYKMQNIRKPMQEEPMKLLNPNIDSPCVLNNFNIIIKLIIIFLTFLKCIIRVQITNVTTIACNLIIILPFHTTLTYEIYKLVMIVYFQTYFVCGGLAQRRQNVFLVGGQIGQEAVLLDGLQGGRRGQGGQGVGVVDLVVLVKDQSDFAVFQGFDCGY